MFHVKQKKLIKKLFHVKHGGCSKNYEVDIQKVLVLLLGWYQIPNGCTMFFVHDQSEGITLAEFVDFDHP